MFFFRKRLPQPLLKRRWRLSLRSSLLLHTVAPPLAEPQPQPVEIGAYFPANENWLANDSVDISHLEAANADPRWELLTDNNLDQRPAAEQQEASSFLSRQVMRSIAESEAKSDEDNLERLRSLAAQQNDISTQQSVAEINAQLSKFLGTGPRASEPAKEPVAGDFDFDTGQLHDMKREMLEDGKFKYTAILVDSAGRKMETEMNAADGGSAYKTFELIKQNPLLERVYRGVVMSLLDKIIKPSSP
jgi:hypothetical protein